MILSICKRFGNAENKNGSENRTRDEKTKRTKNREASKIAAASRTNILLIIRPLTVPIKQIATNITTEKSGLIQA